MVTKKPAAKRQIAREPTAADREEAHLALTDLFRHAAMRQRGDKEAKLPTRLRKLEGLDDVTEAQANIMLQAAPSIAQLVLTTMEKLGWRPVG